MSRPAICRKCWELTVSRAVDCEGVPKRPGRSRAGRPSDVGEVRSQGQVERARHRGGLAQGPVCSACATRRRSHYARKFVPRVHAPRDFRHGGHPTGASCLLEGSWGRVQVREREPRVHAARGSWQNRPQGTGGCRKANPACTHTAGLLTWARRDTALPQLAGRRGLGVAGKLVPRVRMGRGFWHGPDRRGEPAGVRGRGPGPDGVARRASHSAASPLFESFEGGRFATRFNSWRRRPDVSGLRG
jgi:hypothetical protein